MVHGGGDMSILGGSMPYGGDIGLIDFKRYLRSSFRPLPFIVKSLCTAIMSIQ